MKKILKTILKISCLELLIILCYHNLSYAGNIGKNSGFETIFSVIMYSPLIIFMFFLFLSAIIRDSSLNKTNKIVKNKGKKYNILKVILYAVLISVIIFIKNVFLTITLIFVISLFFMISFWHILHIEKKQNRQEHAFSKEKIEKDLVSIRDNIYIFFCIITCFGLITFEKIETILALLVLFIATSFLILSISSKKKSIVIGFISLILSSLIVLHYWITI